MVHLTLDDVRQWPPTVSVAVAARALGCSRAHAYDLAKRGEFPVRLVQLGNMRRVITADLLALLDSQGGTAFPESGKSVE